MKRADKKKARRSSGGSKRRAPSTLTIRSSITNGTDLLPHIDGRSVVARRYRDIQNAIASDLGGLSVMTEAQLQLARSAAGLTLLRERLDAKAVNGESVDDMQYCRISNSLSRVLVALGIERKAKDITPRTPTQQVIDALVNGDRA